MSFESVLNIRDWPSLVARRRGRNRGCRSPAGRPCYVAAVRDTERRRNLAALRDSYGKAPLLQSMDLPLFAGAVLAICLVPGPNVFMTLSFALSQGFGAASRAVFGTAFASVLFLTISALGLVAVLVASVAAFAVVRIAGAVYLVFLGGRLLFVAARARAGVERRIVLTSHPFVQGFVTHLSNPKALLYWTAMLPQFIDDRRQPTPQILLLGVVGMSIGVSVLLAYAALAVQTRHVLDQPRVSRRIDIVAGLFFLVAGGWLFSESLR
jgi:homoserine/homoserine lactone efflux protein